MNLLVFRAVHCHSSSLLSNSQSTSATNPTGEESRAGQGDFLDQIDQKLRIRNERLLRKVQAWGELLDIAGWCVALDRPGGSPWISGNAEWDLRRTGEIPSKWLDLIGRISAESIHQHSEGHLVWSGRVEECAQPEPAAILTRRESEVMSWLREGKTSQEIAIIVGCSARTVEKHLANLYRKLGVKSRAEMILKTSNPIN